MIASSKKRIAAGVLAGIIGISGYGFSKFENNRNNRTSDEIKNMLELTANEVENIAKLAVTEPNVRSVEDMTAIKYLSFIGGADIAISDVMKHKYYNPADNDYYMEYKQYLDDDAYCEGYELGYTDKYFGSYLMERPQEEVDQIIKNTFASFECVARGGLKIEDNNFVVIDSDIVNKTLYEIFVETNNDKDSLGSVKALSLYLGNSISSYDLIKGHEYNPKNNEYYRKYKDYLDEESYEKGYKIPYDDLSIYTFRFEENSEDLIKEIEYICDMLDIVVKGDAEIQGDNYKIVNEALVEERNKTK